MDYKAVFFDWDGTLVEHSKLIGEGHSHVRDHFGVNLQEQIEALARGQHSMGELYPALYGDKWKEAEKLFYDFFYEKHLSDIKPFDDTVRLLDALNRSGKAMGVVSNKKHIFLTREIEHIKWNDYFASIIGAGEAETDKPSAAPLRMAASLLENALQEKDILYVGDTETDMKCAADMGCDFALILRGRDMKDLIDQYKPRYVYDTFTEMVEILEDTNKTTNKKKAC